MYFNNFIPNNEIFNENGIFLTRKKINRDTGEISEYTERFCQIRIMVTGVFTNEIGQRIAEVTYIDKSDKSSVYDHETKSYKKVIYVPLEAVLGLKKFVEILRPLGVRVDDTELKNMIPYFNSCISSNAGVEGSGFKNGDAYSQIGYKKGYEYFVIGNEMFCEECITDHNLTGVQLYESFKGQTCFFMNDELCEFTKPVGSVQTVVKDIGPILNYNRVRFVCYGAFAALLLHPLHVDPFIIDMYGGIPGEVNDKSGSGKSTTMRTALSFLATASGGEGSLFNRCESTPAFVDNKSAHLCDFALGLDESTKLLTDDKDKLAYGVSSDMTKGKASNGKGGTQKLQRKMNVILTTGEYSLISRNSPIGAKSRVLAIEGGIGVSGIGDIVKRAGDCAKENSGHFLRPFLAERFKYNSQINKWYDDYYKLLTETTSNDIAKRRAAYFAAIAVAGRLLEMVFASYGIEEKDPFEVVSELWQEIVLDNPIEGQWRLALEDIIAWYHTNKDINFNTGNSPRPSYGWTATVNGELVLNIIKKKAEEFLTNEREGHKYDPTSVFEALRLNELTYTDKGKPKKDNFGEIIGYYKPYAYKNVTKDKCSIPVIQIRLKKVYELLGYDQIEKIPTGLGTLYTPEERERGIGLILSEETQEELDKILTKDAQEELDKYW